MMRERSCLWIITASQYKDEITHHVEVAKELIENTSLFNDKARQYLSLAYRMTSPGIPGGSISGG
jgi:hypothetical protein